MQAAPLIFCNYIFVIIVVFFVFVVENSNTTKENTDVRMSFKNGNLHVQCPLQDAFVLDVISVDGRQVTHLTGEGQGQFDLSQVVKPGLYLLRIRQEGHVWVEKMMF